MQVIYSNGHASPVFLGKNQDANNLRTIALNSQIKKIRGTSTENGYYVCNIHFQEKNGKEISKISACETEFAPDQILSEDEDIIGIYGDKDYDGVQPYFASIGFIVWKRLKN